MELCPFFKQQNTVTVHNFMFSRIQEEKENQFVRFYNFYVHQRYTVPPSYSIFPENISLVVCWLRWGHRASSEHHCHCQSSVLCPHSTSQQYPASAQQRTIRINKSSEPFGRSKGPVLTGLTLYLHIPQQKATFPISLVLMEPASVSVFITTSQSNQFPSSFYNNNIHFQWVQITIASLSLTIL